MATTQIKDGFNGGSDNQLEVNADGTINVNITGGGGSPNVNLIEVGGSAITLGQGTDSTSLPVVLPADQLPAFNVNPAAKYFTVELANAGLTVIYKFRTGSISGPVVNTITMNYATAQTLILTDGALT